VCVCVCDVLIDQESTRLIKGLVTQETKLNIN